MSIVNVRILLIFLTEMENKDQQSVKPKRSKIKKSVRDLENLVKQSRKLVSKFSHITDIIVCCSGLYNLNKKNLFWQNESVDNHMQKIDVLELVIEQLKSQARANNQCKNFRCGIDYCVDETLSFLRTYNDEPAQHLIKEAHERLLHKGMMMDSMQNRLTSQENRNCEDALDLRKNCVALGNSHVNATNRLGNTLSKKEILQKLRFRIFEKRRLRSILGRHQESMWRPW